MLLSTVLGRRSSLGLAAAVGLAGARAGAQQTESLQAGPLQAWASVLHDHVDGLGRVDFAAIEANPRPLAEYISYVAATPPDSVPAGAARLGYLINSYNALSMQHVIDSGIPRRLSLLDRVRFFKFSQVMLGGRQISLYDYETDIIRPIGDARVHFALNCMSVSCPRLPRVPFAAAGLDAQLDTGARLFFAEPRNLRIEPLRGVVMVSAILDFYTADFLRHAPSLAAYINLFRTEPVSVADRVEFLDYDWTINRQPVVASRPD